MMFGRYFEDFEVGTTISHERAKTILASDNNLFCLLTMNHHPVHLDWEYSRMAHHGQPLVVGTLVFSLAVGLTVDDISGKAIANLGYADIEHHKPVFIGDTIHVQTRIVKRRQSRSKPDRGIVQVETEVFNQDNALVLTFTRRVLVPLEEEYEEAK